MEPTGAFLLLSLGHGGEQNLPFLTGASASFVWNADGAAVHCSPGVGNPVAVLGWKGHVQS